MVCNCIYRANFCASKIKLITKSPAIKRLVVLRIWYIFITIGIKTVSINQRCCQCIRYFAHFYFLCFTADKDNLYQCVGNTGQWIFKLG
jgi:hypothetical protein